MSILSAQDGDVRQLRPPDRHCPARPERHSGRNDANPNTLTVVAAVPDDRRTVCQSSDVTCLRCCSRTFGNYPPMGSSLNYPFRFPETPDRRSSGREFPRSGGSWAAAGPVAAVNSYAVGPISLAPGRFRAGCRPLLADGAARRTVSRSGACVDRGFGWPCRVVGRRQLRRDGPATARVDRVWCARRGG